MNPPGTKPFPSARFPWSKGVMRKIGPGRLRLGSGPELRRGEGELRPLRSGEEQRMDTGIASQNAECARPGGRVAAGVWVGQWAGPVLFTLIAGSSLLLFPGTLKGDDWSVGSRGILSDGLPRYAQPIREAAPDLYLKKANENIAEALAAFAMGLAAEENADFERALEAYQQTLALDASNTELAVKVAFTLAQQGKVPQAIDILKDAEKASPKDLIPPLGLSQLYGKYLKKPKLAERYALKAHRLDANNIGPYLALYEIYKTSDQGRKAAEIFRKAAESETTDPLFWLQLAEARIQEAPAPGAQFPASEVPTIAPLLEKALAGGGDDIPTLVKVAENYILMWQLDKAAPLLRKATELTPTPGSEEMLQVREKLARCLLGGEKQEEGIAVLEKLIRDAPSRLETYELLAEWYTLQEDPARAVEIYRQALEVDDTQVKYHLRIAQVQAAQEKYDDAVATMTAARRHFPRQAFVTYVLAQTLLQAERYGESLKIFREAMQEGHYSNDEVLSAGFFFDYGTAAERSGNLELAAQCLRRSIELDPENAAPAYNYLGYMWADEGVHLPEALELIEHALRYDPENPAYLDSLGWVYYRMGKLPEAIDYLKRAIERMVPEEAILFDHLGDALHASGNLEEAITNWKKALELDPENKEIREKVTRRAVAEETTETNAGEEGEDSSANSATPAVLTSSGAESE